MYNQGMQYLMEKSRTLLTLADFTESLIVIIKGKWKQRTFCRRITRNCWSFGLVWEAEIYSRTSYKDGTTGMEHITGDTIDVSQWTDFFNYDLCQY